MEGKMRKFLSLLIIPLLVFSFSGMAFGWGSTGGDGSDYHQLQETAVFYNNTVSTQPDTTRMYHGQAVILDLDGTGVTSGTTLGAYVELPAHGNAGGDSVLVVGVVAEASSNGFAVSSPVVVVTKGAALAQITDAADAVTGGNAVGTCDAIGAGNVGDGSNLGIALENGDGTDSDEIIIWVDPTGAD